MGSANRKERPMFLPITSETEKCAGVKKDGQPCRATVMKGRVYCGACGGPARFAREEREQREAAREDERALRKAKKGLAEKRPRGRRGPPPNRAHATPRPGRAPRLERQGRPAPPQPRPWRVTSPKMGRITTRPRSSRTADPRPTGSSARSARRISIAGQSRTATSPEPLPRVPVSTPGHQPAPWSSGRDGGLSIRRQGFPAFRTGPRLL